MNVTNLLESESSFNSVGGTETRFNSNQYLLCIRDPEERFIIKPIFYYNYGSFQKIDAEKIGDKILTIKNSKVESLPLNQKFDPNEFIKISFGYLQNNTRYDFDNSEPKVTTFLNHVNHLEPEEFIEIYEGILNEENSVLELSNISLFGLFSNSLSETQKPFFVNFNNQVIGPFKINRVNSLGQLIISESDYYPFGTYDFNANSYVELNINSVNRKLILNSQNLDTYFIKKETFTSDKELIARFKSYIEKYPNDLNPEKLTEFLEFIERAKTLDYAFANDKNKFRLQSLIKKNEEKILNFVEIGDIVSNLGTLKNELEDLQEQKLNYSNILLEQEKEIQNNEIAIQELSEEVSKLILNFEKEKESKKNELEQQLDDLIKRKQNLENEIQEDINQKSGQIEELKILIKHLEKDKESIENAIKTLKDQFTSEQRSSHEKLKEILIANQHFNIISGRDFSEFHSDEDNFENFETESIILDVKEKLKFYIQLRSKIIEILERNNRKFDQHFIDNILISIHQNTLTLFAGLPGTGKTSLVKLITQILAPKERIREVSVGRGWSSQKDLIGFFNPLSNTFNASPTNIFSLLKQLNFEVENNLYLNSPMAYILLDEANLSTMEHYWSEFYNLTDNNCKDNSYLNLNFGKDLNLKYPNNIRFIGTINYDQSTEELSPRVIDRSNIIRMNPKAVEIGSLKNEDIQSLKISFKDCIELFDLIDFNQNDISYQWGNEMESLFDEIKIKFEELRIFISPRVIIAIKQYCNIAFKVMKEEYKPLDYCISQRILPLINVNGENAKIKLEEILKLLKEKKMDISAKILDDILSVGSEGEIFQDNFNYFLAISHV